MVIIDEEDSQCDEEGTELLQKSKAQGYLHFAMSPVDSNGRVEVGSKRVKESQTSRKWTQEHMTPEFVGRSCESGSDEVPLRRLLLMSKLSVREARYIPGGGGAPV